MKNEIKMFFIGFVSGIAAIMAFILGRKTHISDGDGIRSDNPKYDDCAESLESIENGIAETENGITTAIGILQGAKERSAKENDSV